MGLSSAKKTSISEVLSEWDDISELSFDSATPYDWRSSALRALKDKNIAKMKLDAAPLAEYNVIDIMQNSPSDATRLDAAKYILSQAGHGPIQKVEHNVVYEKMEVDQLSAILQSRIEKLQRLAPGLTLAPPAVDAEIVEEPVIESSDAEQS
jgi:hypothetical protein